MCSIFGWIPAAEYAESAVVNFTAERVANVMNSRGPDDRGWNIFGINGSVSNEKSFLTEKCFLMLGQNRLSIIDLSSAGHQPMSSPDGRYTIVYNGEVYNYKELRIILEQKGHKFGSNTDTEVVLYSFIEWGKDCLLMFEGMFAFAVFDKQEKTLFCARDFFGIKPFYYQSGDNGFTFASEIPALLEFPGTERKLNIQKAYEYLVFGSVDAGRDTMIKGIHQLLPAHYCVIDVKTGAFIEYRRYWEIDLSQKSSLSFKDAAAKLRNLFLESIKLHLRSDVPLGIALSGGIDSSAVACAVRHLYPDIPIHTFSYIAHECEKLSEEEWVDIVNEYIGAVSHKIYVNSGDLFNDLDKLVRRLGEPFGGTSIYAQYRVFQMVRKAGVTVTLDGQGADELLAGYVYYAADRIESLLRKKRFSEAYSFWGKLNNSFHGNKIRTGLQAIARFSPESIKQIARYIISGDTNKPAWLNIDYLNYCDVKFMLNHNELIYKHNDKLRQSLANSSTITGLPNLLRHGDRNSMTWSVESRVPFCNRRITEFVLSLPEEYLIDQSGLTKSVFREAMRGIVPDAILDRRDKIGFETPENKWFPGLSAWVKPVLEKAKESKLLNYQVIKKEWDFVETGEKPFNGIFWRQINYLRWIEIFNIEE